MSEAVDIPVTKKKPQARARTPKPEWIRTRVPSGENYLKIKNMLKDLKLATVCQEAMCPNMAECWSGGTATVMLLGDTCTRACKFCNVKTAKLDGTVDEMEPQNTGYAIGEMGLEYVVLTSVDRDDLEDGGSGQFAKTIQCIKEKDQNVIIEVLTSDFQGNLDHTAKLMDAGPDVYAQNVETVERLTHKVRDRRAGYWQTLDILEFVKQRNPKMYTKTSIMLGLGETDEEIRKTLRDLREVGCDVVTFGQYLQPTKRHLSVEEYITPEKFAEWKTEAEDMGFLYVASGPMVRSSYKAAEFFMKGVVKKQRINNEDRGNNGNTDS